MANVARPKVARWRCTNCGQLCIRLGDGTGSACCWSPCEPVNGTPHECPCCGRIYGDDEARPVESEHPGDPLVFVSPCCEA